MNYRLLLALLAAALTLNGARAQSDDDDDDDQEYDYFAYFSRAHSNLTFGFKATQGAKVKFGNLGSIPVADPGLTLGAADVNIYANGVVTGDSPRANEVLSTTTTSAAGTRYQTHGLESDPNGNPTFDPSGHQVSFTSGDFLSYATGFTRSYSINNATQVVDGNVVMTQYSVVSDGAAFEGKKSFSGGVEMQAERLFTDPAKRFRFSLVAGLSLNGINSKKAGTVSSTLRVLTDTYAISGGALPATAVFPYNTTATAGATGDSSATTVILDTNLPQVPITVPQEITAPLNIVNFGGNRNITDDEETDVTGVWEIKGAYFVLRIGPEFSASVTPNLSFSASAGVAGAYVGTNYTAIESALLTDPTVTTSTLTTGAITSEENKFLPGYYANFDASWAVNERTGFYAGLSYESFGDFTQTLAGRTARIDLSGNASLRGGLNIKF